MSFPNRAKDMKKKVTTVLKLPDGTMKIREGQAGLTITGQIKGDQFMCETEYGVGNPNEARALVVMALHWLNDTFPDMTTKAIATFLIESGISPKEAEGVYLKFKDIK